MISQDPDFWSGPRISRLAKAQFYLMFGLKHYLEVGSRDSGKSRRSRHERLSRRVHEIIEKFDQSVFERIEEDVGAGGEQREREIPRVSPADMSPRMFQETYFKDDVPVIIEGLLSDTKAVKTWSLQSLRDRYYDDPVVVSCRKKFDLSAEGGAIYTPDKLGNALSAILEGRDLYIAGYGDLFRNNPELLEELDVSRLVEYYRGKRRGQPLHSQLFIGLKGAGSEYHCAPGSNMFAMIHGEKDWVMVPPAYTPCMVPSIKDCGAVAYSPIDGRNLDDLPGRQRLYRNVPRYSGRVKSGDALYVPAWWWHRVENVTESIGASIRFPPRNLFVGNVMLMSVLLMYPGNYKQMIKQALSGGRTLRDEDVLGLIVNWQTDPGIDGATADGSRSG